MKRRKPKPELWWTDDDGTRRRVPQIKDRLRPHQIAGHAALRLFVFKRDGWACKRCGAEGGTLAGPAELVPDHIVSRRNGGSHHPSNLQTLCKPCNDRKSNYEDRGRKDDMQQARGRNNGGGVHAGTSEAPQALLVTRVRDVGGSFVRLCGERQDVQSSDVPRAREAT